MTPTLLSDTWWRIAETSGPAETPWASLLSSCFPFYLTVLYHCEIGYPFLAAYRHITTISGTERDDAGDG